MITFLKNHVKHKKGDQVESHPNQEYLEKLGVIQVGEGKPKKKPAKKK